MTSRGNIVPAATEASVASASPVAQERIADAPRGDQTSAHLKGGWQLFGMSYHTAGEQPRDVNDALWPSEIARPPSGPGTSLAIDSVALDNGARSLMLSVANQGPEVCDSGPNDVNSTRDYAICPGKVAIIAGDQVTAIRSVGPLCVETINVGGEREGAPDWKDPRRWGTRARYNAASKTVELVTMQSGQVEPECSKIIKIN